MNSPTLTREQGEAALKSLEDAVVKYAGPGGPWPYHALIQARTIMDAIQPPAMTEQEKDRLRDEWRKMYEGPPPDLSFWRHIAFGWFLGVATVLAIIFGFCL